MRLLARLIASLAVVAALAVVAGCGDGSGPRACSFEGSTGKVYRDVVVSGGASCDEIEREIFHHDEELPFEWDCSSERIGDGSGSERFTCTNGERRAEYTV